MKALIFTRSFYFKVGAIFFSLFLFVFLIEGGLRLTGFLMSKDLPQKTDINKIRILALGESTTALAYEDGMEISWPTILQQQLDNNPSTRNKFVVYNKGVSGTSSTFILQDLLKNLDEVDPHIVITMMGVNDYESFNYLHKNNYWFERFKIYKLYHWIKNGIQNYGIHYPTLIETNLIISECTKAVFNTESGFKFEAHLIMERFPRLKWFVALSCSSKFFITYQKMKVAKSEQIIKIKLDDAIDLAVEAYTKNPRDVRSFNLLIYYSSHFKNLIWLEPFFEEALRENLVPSQQTLTLSAPFINNKKINKVLSEWNIKGVAWNKFINLQINYFGMAKTLKEKKINFYIMSYPTLSVNVFKNIFSEKPVKFRSIHESFYYPFSEIKIKTEYSDIKYISNENFINKIGDKNQSLYFKDLFIGSAGGKFGHTTLKGNQLIATNVYNELSAYNLKN